ncbi:MAG: 1,2-phenylacetyl-CoA epoxidase subunit PaaE [Beijerinckiaceae bacterium]
MSAHIPRFHRLRIDEVKRETADAISLTFAIPDDLKPDYTFAPGQYLTLRRLVEGEDIRRSYSICSGPDDNEVRIAIKRVEGGRFSTWATDALKAGDAIDVMTPTGRFGVVPSPQEARVHVGFAAGSGITPILSIIRAVLAREPKSRFFLFYGNRSTNDMLFRDALVDLKDRFLERFSMFHALSQEEQDIPVMNGRLDAGKVRLLLSRLVPVALIDHAFICGPTGMSEAIESLLKEGGLPAERIHVERFVSASSGAPRPKPVVRPDAATKTAVLIVDGQRKEIPVAEGEAVLDAALRAGIDLPYACKGGMCCSCRAKLVGGQAEMDVNYSLEPWELDAGFILTCQAHPLTERVTIDYDQM